MKRPARSIVNGLELDKETTHDLVRWPRVTWTRRDAEVDRKTRWRSCWPSRSPERSTRRRSTATSPQTRRLHTKRRSARTSWPSSGSPSSSRRSSPVRKSKFNLCFNLGSLAVCVRCCSLESVECISRRSCPSLSRNQGRGAEIARHRWSRTRRRP